MKKVSTSLIIFVIMTLSLAACSGGPQAMLSEGGLDDVLQLAAGAIEEPVQAEAATVEETTSAAPTVAAPAAVQPGTLAAYEDTLTAIYELVNPSVVNIQVKVEQTQAASFQGLPEGMPELPFFNMPGDPTTPEQPQTPQYGYGMGSGFVWDQAGHIVTNNHVIDNAVEIEVRFSDGTSVPAELVGTDPYSDLAVLKVDLPAEFLRPIQVADSNLTKVGQLAVAIGNPFGLDGTMTVGIVSALGRTLPAAEGTQGGPTFSIPNVIQTDAPINPGNSGGVLVNDEGQLIGVPTAIESPVRANAGIGFAVPSATVAKVAPALIKDGVYQHSYLGISGTALNRDLAEAMSLDPMQRGALVTDVTPNGPADQAGLRGSEDQVEIDGQPVPVGGDVIIAVDGVTVRDMDDLIAYLTSSTVVGQQIELTVLRSGKQINVSVTLAARPGQNGEQAALEQPRAQGQAWLGITSAPLIPEIADQMGLGSQQSGVLVETVEANSPADQAGLRGGDQQFSYQGQEILIGGDVIVALDGKAVENIVDLKALLDTHAPGDEVVLTVLRNSVQIQVQVTLGSRGA